MELGECIALDSLYMQGNFIQGDISQSMKKLRGLQYVDLSRNNLSGEIPIFFETLTLKFLNLSWNYLEGEVHRTGVFANASAFSVVGNERLCGGILELQLPRCSSSNRSHKHKMSWVRVIILIASITVLLTIGFLLYLNILKKPHPESDISITPIRLSYDQLREATNGFSWTNIISRSGSGLVYKGKLGTQYQNEADIAIKVFNIQDKAAVNRFMKECEALRYIRHKNIVKILSMCSSITEKNNEFKAIVYGNMEHGSVEKWQQSASKISYDKLYMPQILNLGIKINIAIDVASALDYLHNQMENPLVYRNLKPSNVLLDTEMRAHITNFGLAKFEFNSTSQSSIDGLVGKTEYVPPEYGLGGTVSTKGDVYSYGIFLLEMLTGKKTTDPMFHKGFTLQNFVSGALRDGVKEIIDLVNLNELTRHDAAQSDNCLSMLFNIGVKCALECPQFRPDISDILTVLEKVRIIFKGNTGRTRGYARKRAHDAVLKTQNNLKSLLSYGPENMAPSSASTLMLPSVTVSYMDLHKATNGLSLTNLVGAGGYGSVYKGTLHQTYVFLLLRNSGIEDGTGTAVAIKVFNLQRRGAARSFNTEYKILRNIHHRNLVKLITSCATVDQEGHNFRAILYEFMDHGSLDTWLHPTNKTSHDGPIKPQTLNLQARINVAIDVACALSYLHHQCENCIIHCDLKPSNILLDKNMVARIADFGLAISLPEDPNQNQSNSSTGLRGTTGYIAPEYGLGCKMTTKGDTYSFGILLLEMLTGIRPTHRMFSGGLNLHNFVSLALPNDVINITDPLMKVMTSVNKGDGKRLEKYLIKLFNIGLACSRPSQKDRLDMRAVLRELESIRNNIQLN